MAICDTASGNSDTKGPKGHNNAKDLAPEGALPSFKTLYQGPMNNDKKWTWFDKEPQDIAEAAENDETAQYALIRRLQSANDSRKKFQIHSIIIQSPWLKEALAEILVDYPGIHCGLKRLEFEAPFKPFVHRWSQLLQYRAREDLIPTTAEHLELLYKVLSTELEDVIKTLDDYVKHGIVTFQHIWTIYQPGSIIYSDSHNGAYAAYRLSSGAYVETRCGNAYQLSLEVLDYDGTGFGRRIEELKLWEFLGTTRILGLSAFPLSFHPHREKIEGVLIARGKKFEQLAGCHYRSYDGFAITWDKEGKEVPLMCNGRIVVDANSFWRLSHRSIPSLQPLAAKEGAPNPACAEKKTEIIDPTDTKYVFGVQTKSERLRLTEEHHLICLPRVRGYSLKKKQWLLFYLDLIQDIKFDSNAFGSLVLPADQKELILSFAESQAMNSTGFDDIISGKGRGHITLLSGPPGVGKTLTAESVAEHMQAPLFMMSASDLGVRPNQVESRLADILEMIAKWKAVLLIDECDVFLAARSTHDLERNKLVSIFLRMLEYYEGLLFLTTNRVDNMDAAFQSRIHVSMAFPDLTFESRRQIWDNFLKGLNVQQEWKSEDLDDLAKVDLNGRQIKNVLKSGALLAARKKDGLRREYVEMVLAIEQKRPDLAEALDAK